MRKLQAVRLWHPSLCPFGGRMDAGVQAEGVAMALLGTQLTFSVLEHARVVPASQSEHRYGLCSNRFPPCG